MLSHNRDGAAGRKICKSRSSLQIRMTSVAELAKLLKSASVEERATVGCLLLDQEMGLEPKNTISTCASPGIKVTIPVSITKTMNNSETLTK